jgi:5-methylcytosine-specific restriction endonuclease McrA
MEKCKCCNINNAIKYSKYSNGEFCSIVCARSFASKEKREEINKKVSEKLSGKITNPSGLSKETWEEINRKVKETWDNKILNSEFSDLSYERLRKRIILEQKGKCNKCGLNEWLGEKIPLEVDHIDGNHKNNNRENLVALCPNCHSLTPTWRGRNKKTNVLKIDDEKLLKTLIEYNFNMRQTLLSLGFAAKGGNYKRCHRLKIMYEDVINNQ